jgi:hypothetical protein
MRDARNRIVIASVLATGAALLAGCFPTTDGDTPPSPPSPVVTAPNPPPSSSPASTPDPWAGYFDDTAKADPGAYDSQFWGSFGDPGGVFPVQNEDQRLAAGTYIAEVVCAGAPEVQASFTDLGGEPLGEAITVTCPGSVMVDIELAEPGIIMMLDTQREPGAYLVRFTPVD